MPLEALRILWVAEPSPALDEAVQALSVDGHALEVLGDGRAALERAAALEPQLVVADVDLPDLDGYELQAAWGDAYPGRAARFVLLTSADSPREILRGLAAGTHDYLLKPVALDVLRAKLGRLTAPAGPATSSLDGDLSALSVAELVELCRDGGLSGEVELRAPGRSLSLRFLDGEMVAEPDRGPDELLAAAAAFTTGSFVLRAVGAERSAAVGPRHDGDGAEPGPSRPPPAGKLTDVALGEHLVSVETQLEEGDAEQIATVVLVDGRVRKRTTSYPPPDADHEALERYIASQHEAVEAGIRGKVEALLAKKQQRSEPTSAELERFVGLLRRSCARQDFVGAREILAGALALFPQDPTIVSYARFVRSKLP